MTEEKIRIFNVQKYNMYDGPGVRTIIFFQGCPLRCKWCANPEGLEKKPRIMFKENLCENCGDCVNVCPVGKHEMDIVTGKHKINSEINCIGCGKCEDTCYESAIKIMGEDKSISEIMDIIEEDRIFYEMSGGGVTLGGGEVLMQPEGAINLLKACKSSGFNTAIETCGYTTKEIILEAGKYVDLFLFDLKHINSEEHLKWTGVRNERILENLDGLMENGFNVQIRMPLLKGVNSEKEDIKNIGKLLEKYKNYENFKGIDLLPYHKMGVNKYIQLGMKYPLEGDPSLTDNELENIEEWIKEYELPVKVVKH
ncbi:pyruvate formate lyase activating enzyme [Cetobacterium ceti]|uniref:Pyruvate formate lyase activating enzyme n=1 Tax=Cetobacterium ceti TaxID=180163 RepID=A0A1T4NL79_9FUSO|nr:choline TMA-lyase-activating enzyme [Cetobacterium ceti]SJZ79875.1 pyruvate formate lyase activating enzyme [Cetobacterium ceti]